MPSLATIRLIGAGLLVLLLVAALLWGPAACNRIRGLEAQSKVDRGQTEALGNSAADAVETQGKANQRETESEAVTRSNEKEIRNADGANDPVNPAVRDAGLRSLCRRAAYRNSERCRVFATPAR
jgi:type II secretory pathway component PulM